MTEQLSALRDAVNPSVEAVEKTSCFLHPGDQIAVWSPTHCSLVVRDVFISNIGYRHVI
jgi:hypothetical protein